MKIPVTVVETENHQPFGKMHELVNGKLVTTTKANVSALKFHVREVAGLPGLSDLLNGGKDYESLIIGTPEQEEGLILSAGRMANYKGEKPAIQRNSLHLKFSEGHSLLLVDFDPPEGSKPRSACDVVQLFRKVNPELAKVRFLSKPSASAYIYHGDRMLRGAWGWHLYCVVDQGSLIPAAAKLIEARLWVAGYGRIKIGDSGNRIPKTLIDMAVYAPQHLDFIRGHCKPPLSQRMPPPQIHEPTTPGDGIWRLAETLGFAP